MSRRRSLAATAAVACALAGVACGGGTADDGGPRLPALTLDALAAPAAPLQLGELTGPAVVNLWATWCAPCRRELPDFQRVSDRRPDVRFVGIDVGEDPAAARTFLDALGVTFEQYTDEHGELGDALGVASLPVTVVLDERGLVATRRVGAMSAADLVSALDDL